jgi:Immunity protein 8
MMINAELKGLFTSDMDILEVYNPRDGSLFEFTARAMIGPKGDLGEESFDFQVCTPGWLAQECERSGFVFGRRMLIVSEYDPAHIKSILTSLVQRVTGESWQVVAQKLSRFAHWEFEDYKE